MSKKAKLPLIFLAGLALVIVGFCLPVFQVNFLGKHGANGFALIKKSHDTVNTICLVLVFAGAVASLVSVFVKFPKSELVKLLGFVLSIAAGLFIYFNMDKFGIKIAAKALGPGFYCIVAGWIASAAGYVLKK